jgi:phytoene dehydrogenase-like protein
MDELRLSASGHRVHLFEHSDYSGGQAQYGERHAFRASIQKESLNHPHPAPCLADD